MFNVLLLRSRGALLRPLMTKQAVEGLGSIVATRLETVTLQIMRNPLSWWQQHIAVNFLCLLKIIILVIKRH